MPIKPSKEVIEAASKRLDPRDLLNVIANEDPLIRESVMESGVLDEEKEE